MLFTLSSNGEVDHAKFSNYFNNSYIVKPNSFICYIAGSVVEDLNNTIISIPANTTIQLRFDSLNQHQATITTVDKNYSIRELRDRLNELLNKDLYINRRFICKVINSATSPGNLELNFTYYTPETADLPDQNFLKYSYPLNTGFLANEGQQQLNYPCVPPIGATYANGFNLSGTVLAAAGRNWMRTVFASDGTNPGPSSAVQPTGNATYLLNGVNYGYGAIRNTNRESFNLCLGLTQAEDFDLAEQINQSQFTIQNSPVATGAVDTHQYNMTIGHSTHDIGTNQFTDAPIPGLASFAQRPLHLTWKGNGVVTCQVRNTNSGNLDTVYEQKYDIGTMYKISNKLSNVFPRDIDEVYMPLIKQYSYDGLVFFLPGSVNTTGGTYGTALTFNTKQVLYNPGINWCYKNAARTAEDAINSLDWISATTRLAMNNCYTGCWGGQGFVNSSRNNNTTPMYRDGSFGAELNEVIEVTAPFAINAVSYLSHLPIYKRVDTTTPEPNTPNSSKKNRLNLNLYGTMLRTNLPCAFSILFRADNDSAVVTLPNSFTMTLIGGRHTLAITRTPVLQFALGGLAAYDLRIYDDAGAAVDIILNDAAAARPNIQYSRWYHIFYQDDGGGNFGVRMTDIENNVQFNNTGAPILPSGRLANPMTLGSSDDDGTLNGADNYFAGSLSQFQFYVKPRTATTALADFDAVRTNLVDAYVEGTDNNNSVMKPTETDMLYPANFNDYCCLPDIDVENTNTPVFYGQNITGANESVYGCFADVMWLENVKMPYGSRNRNTNMIDMTDPGVGLTDLNALHNSLDFINYDAINQRVINESLPNFTVGRDLPWFQEAAEVSQVALEDECFNVEVLNLPHRTLNGKNHAFDKTIYQLPVETTSKEIQGVKITEHSAEQKVWIPLNNPGEIPINKLDIQISKEDGTKAQNLQEDTHVVIQIEQRDDIL